MDDILAALIYERGDVVAAASRCSMLSILRKNEQTLVQYGAPSADQLSWHTYGAFIEKLFANKEIPEGTFVDIGAGTGNVVAWVSALYRQKFTEVHAIDVNKDDDIIEGVKNLTSQSPTSLPIKWWKAVPWKTSVNVKYKLKGGKLEDVLDSASFIYSANQNFDENAAIFYIDEIVNSLGRKPRELWYLTFKAPPGRTRNTKSGKFGTVSYSLETLEAKMGEDISWKDTPVYLLHFEV